MGVVAEKSIGRGMYVGYYYGSVVYADLSQRLQTTMEYEHIMEMKRKKI